MVRALAIISTLAVFVASAAAGGTIPPDQEWQIVDTHTQQPDCLKATNRKCDVVDIAQVTQEGRRLAEQLSGHVHNRWVYPAQFKADTDAIAANWRRTADILNASLPLDANHDFYQRMAAADMVHWTLHLPLFTVFHWMADNKKSVRLDKKVIKAGVQTIYTQSNVLATVAFDYLPTEPPIIREQIGNLRQWLTDEFEDMLAQYN